MVERMLTYRDLEAAGYGSRQTIWRKVRRGQFPSPIDIGNGQIRFPEGLITQHRESLPVPNWTQK